MKVNKYAMFAMFASLLMILSAGAVLFVEHESEGAGEQQEIDRTVTVQKNDAGTIEIVETKKSEQPRQCTINGISIEGSVVTLDNVNYKTSSNVAFNVMENVGNLTINIKGKNTIVSGVANTNMVILLNSTVTIKGVGSDNKLDIVCICKEKMMSTGIYAYKDLSINGVNIDISIGGATACVGIDEKMDANLKIINSTITVTCGDCKTSFVGCRANLIDNSKITIIDNSTVSYYEDGLLMYQGVINKSVITIRLGSVNPTTDVYETRAVFLRERVSISNSSINAIAGKTNDGAHSYGLVNGSNVSPSISNTDVNVRGYTGAICNCPYGTQDFTPMDMSVFKETPFLAGCKSIDGNDFEEIKTEKISLDYKHIITGLTRTVSYSLNGGSGSYIKPIDVQSGTEFTVSGSDASKYGYTFDGWTDGTHHYKPGEKVRMGADNICLKAVWKENPPMDMGWIVIILMFAMLLIIGIVFRRRDEEED